MKFGKKLLSLTMALILAVSVAIPALATGGPGEENEPGPGAVGAAPLVGGEDFAHADAGKIDLFKLDIAAYEAAQSQSRGITVVYVGNSPAGVQLQPADVVGWIYDSADSGKTKIADVTLGDLAALSNITFRIEEVVFSGNSADDRTDPAKYTLVSGGIDSYAQTNASGKIIWTGLPNSIYRVTEIANSTGTVLDKAQFLVSLPMVDPADATGATTTNQVYVYPKNRKTDGPDIEKEIDDSAASHNGNVIAYKLTADIPESIKSTQGQQNFVITDMVGSGLDFIQNSVTVYYLDNSNMPVVLTTTSPNQYDLAFAANPEKMTITLKQDGYSALAAVINTLNTKKLFVTYNAVVNMTDAEFADLGTEKDPVTNKAKLEFTNDDGYTYTPGEGEEIVDGIAALEIVKYDGATDVPGIGSTTTFLPGAKFKVYTALSGINVDLTSVLKNADGSEVELLTAADGTIIYNGLLAGTYYLVETQVPTGYKALSGYATVIITSQNVIENATVSTSVANYLDNGITLPSTGGEGTLLFVLIGAGLILAAGIVLVVSKKRSGKQK